MGISVANCDLSPQLENKFPVIFKRDTLLVTIEVEFIPYILQLESVITVELAIFKQ